MHIHENYLQFLPNALEVSQAARAEADDQRAAETRRKLRKAAAEAASAGTEEESLLIHRWLEDAENHARSSREHKVKPAREWSDQD